MTILKHIYKTPVGCFDEILLEEEKSLRLILTGKCNLACEFCAYKIEDFYSPEINSPDFMEMRPTEKLRDTLAKMKESLNYNIVHLTGGEPTLSKDLLKIAELAKSVGFAIHICSNLISSNPLLELLNRDLLDELTFSYFPLDLEGDRQQLPKHKGPNEWRMHTILENVKDIKSKFPKLTIKTNICISEYTNIPKLIEFIGLCWEMDIIPRIQRDRSLDRISGSTDKTLDILKLLDVKPEKAIVRVPSSIEICEFSNSSGKKLYVKLYNQNFRLKEICKSCAFNNKCGKSLSTIKIYETKDGTLMRFCTVNNESFSNLNIDDFLQSSVLAEIKNYKNDKFKYFKKFCENPNFQ